VVSVTLVLPSGAFSSVEQGAAKYWNQVPAGIDVLVTHGPPFGTLDKNDILSWHMGCKQLTKPS
jgi:Icc-related predicted phosphoesterase